MGLLFIFEVNADEFENELRVNGEEINHLKTLAHALASATLGLNPVSTTEASSRSVLPIQ